MRLRGRVDDERLRALCVLCREVVRADAGVAVSLRDAVPRLELRSVTGVVVDVRVDDDGGDFVYRPSFERHTTDDIAGAVRAVLGLLRTCEGRPGGS